MRNRAKIVETRNNIVVSTQQFVFPVGQMGEERDGSGNLTKQFFALGQTTSGTTNKYFYGLSIRGDVCTITDISGSSVAAVSYNPWGQYTVLSGSFSPDFGYAGMYQHASSALNLTWTRAYSPRLGRWLSRDLLGETVGMNLYAYVDNEPIRRTDPLGLAYIVWVCTHPVIVFEDGVVGPTGPQVPNAGYYWGGFGPSTEDLSLSPRGKEHYDDAAMRQAVNDANSSGEWQPANSGPHGYCLFRHNCQHYLNDVLKRCKCKK